MQAVTLCGAGSARLTVQRSVFHAYARPAADADSLAAFLEEIRRAHPGARHVVHAWAGCAGERRSSDDGEPAGTGGRPCLAALERAGIRGAAVAVARHFGGTLLGAANLGRAYGEAAAAALEAAPRGVLRREFRQHVPFAGVDRLLRRLAAAGATEVHTEFEATGAVVSGLLPVDAEEALIGDPEAESPPRRGG